MTPPIGRIATVVLLQVTAITLALAVVPIVHTKVIREQVVVPAVTIAQETHKAPDTPQVPVEELPVLMVNQTAVTNVRTATALQAILTIVGITVTAVDAAAVGAAVITMALAVLTALQAVPIVLQAVVQVVQAVQAIAVQVRHRHVDHAN